MAGGYGYGLMIWHERDGQRHVGHPGGLPGFGTLMRWVPELGLSVILLANVTYASARAACGARSSSSPARRRCRAGRPRRPGPAGRARGRRRPRRTLGRRRSRPAVHAERRSRPPAGRAPRRARRSCASATARSTRDDELEPEDALRGSWRLRGERGHVELAITMAPTVPPLVQTLDVESVLPPGGHARVLAAAAPARERAAAPTRSRRCSPRRRRRARRCAGCGRRGPLGPFGNGEPVAGDGETTTTLRLPSVRGDVELELALDAGSGRLLGRLVLHPPAPPGA